MEEKKQNSSNTSIPKEVKPFDYTPEEIKVRGDLITACSTARDQREAPHAEFDDMTYSQYYDTNKRADMSYISPKKNKYDKRIVTGYTREKDNTLLSALLAYNFEPDITVYDDSEIIFPELGNNMEDIVKKTRELEQYGKIRPLIYRELITQGTVFVEEIWECMSIPQYDNSSAWRPGKPIKDAKFEKKLKNRKIERAAVKLHQGKNVYVGDFSQDDYKKQDLVFTYEVISRELAESIYGTWDRWDSVPYQVDNTVVLTDTGSTYYDWNLTQVQKNMVGVLKIQQKFKNRYMIMLNGVMMLPHNFPLAEISPDGEFTIKCQNLEAINGCAYGKGQPAKTKVDQAVHDEFLRLMILRQEQASAPPMGYKGKRVLSPNIYAPGKINNNMREGDLFPILPASIALGNADFSMYQLIKTSIDDKTINATFAGQDTGQGQVTATQILQEKQQQLLKLGLNFDSVKELEKDLVWARIGNILLNYSKPTGTKANKDSNTIDDIYQLFSVETTVDNGKDGVKIFEFTDKAFPDEYEQQREEQVLTKHYGKPVKKVYFNGPKFMELLKFRWVVNIVPTQENSDQVERQLFIQNLYEARDLFGPESLNYDYAKERFAIHIKEDPTKFFIDEDQLAILQQQQQMQGLPAVDQASKGSTPAAQLPQNKTGFNTELRPV